MDWNKILEQAIIGGLMGGLAYLFSKSLNYYKRKTIKIDKKAIKEDYEKVKSKINIPKIKIPYIKLEDKSESEENVDNHIKSDINKKDAEYVNRPEFNMDQKSNLGYSFLLIIFTIFLLFIWLLSSLGK